MSDCTLFIAGVQRVIYSLLIAFMPVISWMAWVYGQTLCIHLGAMMRSVLINGIYRKSFLLSSRSRCSINSGELTNLMSSDSYFVLLSSSLHA